MSVGGTGVGGTGVGGTDVGGTGVAVDLEAVVGIKVGAAGVLVGTAACAIVGTKATP